MVIYSLELAPQRLRGVLARFCLEIRSGLFVGRLDGRMREQLWEKVLQLATKRTRAVMIWREPTEQGYAFRTYGKDRRQPIIVDGIWLVAMEPEQPAMRSGESYPPTATT